MSDATGMAIRVRREQRGDEAAVRRVEVEAFGREMEADIVDRLRAECGDCLSLVAEVSGEIVGHILFAPATIESEQGNLTCAGLGPLAVLPGWQRQGIGAALVRAGLEEMRAAGEPCVLLVGHQAYYPRFGFHPAAAYGTRFDPDLGGVFMFCVFDEATVRAHPGVVRNWLM